jgi:hypothetical protein
MYALTALSPAPHNDERQLACLQTWRAAGLRPVAFNFADEIAELRPRYPIDFVPVTNEGTPFPGRPYTPVNALLDFARAQDDQVLIINSDVTLHLRPAQLERLRSYSSDGLCGFVRHDYHADIDRAAIETGGIDAFLFHGRDAALFPRACFVIGKPWWDFWLPQTFLDAGRKIYMVELPVLFHQAHGMRWSVEDYEIGRREFYEKTRCQVDHEIVRNTFTDAQTTVPPGVLNERAPLFLLRGD